MYSDFIREFFNLSLCRSNCGIVSKVMYNVNQRIVCVFVDLSVKVLLENKNFIKDMLDLTRKCNVKVMYCDDVFRTIPTKGYVTVYIREDKHDIKSKYIDKIAKCNRHIWEFVYHCTYESVLTEAYEILFTSMLLVLETKYKRYKLPVQSLNLLYDDFKKVCNCSKYKLLDKMIPYIEYAKDVDIYTDRDECIYSDFKETRSPSANISHEEAYMLVEEVTSFCCNCINIAFNG